ncbi:MAG: NAD(P)/FAD-dependent oxidoreductase [Victivallaceae bacterium]|nr:FAD-dependent oxidoreductase [Victivallaceae bacterium]
MRMLILGAGSAGFEAACELRRLSPDVEITLISGENFLPYRRPALTRLLAAEVPDNQFYLKPESFYAENRIGLHTGVTIAALNRTSHTAIAVSGEVFKYDRLLLALGASPRVLAVPGCDAPYVFKGRTRSDFDSLLTYLSSTGAASVAVIGGGLLGLEFADALLGRRLKVSIVEQAHCILPRQLDPEAAARFGEIVAGAGVTARYGARLEGIEPKRIVLTNGESIPADAAIFAAGAIPNTALARDAGLAVNHGIVTDAKLSTADTDVFAAGDCAEIDGAVSGLWAPAKEQGKVAAANMLGNHLEYTAAAAEARFAGFGTKIFSAGEVNAAGDDITREIARDGANYRALTRHGGKLVGVLLLGDVSAAPKLSAELHLEF